MARAEFKARVSLFKSRFQRKASLKARAPMTFNSIEFLLFLPLVLALYYVMSHRMQNRMLLLASYFFYGWVEIGAAFTRCIAT
jgi:hypothetical protein